MLYDLSPRIEPGFPVWPGDTAFTSRLTWKLAEGASVNLSALTTTPHLGSHADAPFHTEADGAAIADLPLLPFLGPCRVVAVPPEPLIEPHHLGGLDPADPPRLLLKTGSIPPLAAGRPFPERFSAVSPALARHLGARGTLLVGLDTPSVDPFHSKTLDAHHALAAGGVAILEGLDLSRVPPGVYELIALPLKLGGLDASPVRAVLREVSTRQTGSRKLDTAAGQVRIAEDFDAPLTDFAGDGDSDRADEAVDVRELFLGIDFSGSAAMWSPRRTGSNVWLAFLSRANGRLTLERLLPVQSLPGDGPPFARLSALLVARRYRAAAIDAPFSLPAAVLGTLSWQELLTEVSRRPRGRRPFPEGNELVRRFVEGGPPGKKHYRRTDDLWRRRVNVQSTTWSGPRGGAAMTAAALTLLDAVKQAVWPWTTERSGVVVEAFPAVQLRQWRLPHQGYGKPEQGAAREEIVTQIERQWGIDLGPYRERVINVTDALDAVLAAFAGIAVVDEALAEPPAPEAAQEGWIAVHR